MRNLYLPKPGKDNKVKFGVPPNVISEPLFSFKLLNQGLLSALSVDTEKVFTEIA